MDQRKMYVLSYPDSKKLLDEALKRNHAIENLMQNVWTGTLGQLTKTINKLVYETADKNGMSIYDLCFNTIPDFDGENITLVPINYDLTHDGGYWKEKYFKLKKKMQEVIDNKED